MAPCLQKTPRRLPNAYPETVFVRNTFIDTAEKRSPSLDAFYREREVLTCPSSKVGRLNGLFREPELLLEEEPSRSPLRGQPAGHAASRVLRLAEALGAPVGNHLANVETQTPASYAFQLPEILPAPLGTLPSALEVPYQPHTIAAAPRGMPALTTGMADLAGIPQPPPGPAPGSAELPSIGSREHAAGECKPCAFFHTVGCQNALSCPFCHLCEAGERKRRRREKLDARKAERKARATGP